MRGGTLEGWKVGMWLAGLAACAHSHVPTLQRSIIWAPDNRVMVSDFSEVVAVAASPWLVFAATTHGLLIYDRVSRRFRPPVTTLDGYPQSGVRRAIADPSGNAVWLDLGTVRGYSRYDVDGRTWTNGSIPSMPANATLTVEAALASAPLADAMRSAILTDARLRTRTFTAAAATPDRPEIFFGTNGLGLVRVDKQTGEWEVLSYGLIAPGVGAMASAADGIWAAANAHAGQRRGLTWVARDLAATRGVEGSGAALGFTFLYSRKLLSTGNNLWLATEQGVLRINSSTFQGRLFDLPDATCLAPAVDGIWAGTRRGLSIIRSDDQISNLGPRGVAILSLLAVGETLWVGTTNGLGQLLPGSDGISVPPELADRPSLRVSVYALARLQDTVVMVTERELLWRDPATHAWTSLPLPLSLGAPTALAADANGGGLWLGGTGGVARFEIANPVVRMYPIPREVPAAVRDVLSDGDYLWLATDSGLVRVR